MDLSPDSIRRFGQIEKIGSRLVACSIFVEEEKVRNADLQEGNLTRGTQVPGVSISCEFSPSVFPISASSSSLFIGLWK